MPFYVAAGAQSHPPGHSREELPLDRCVKSLTLLVSRLRTTGTPARRTVETWQETRERELRCNAGSGSRSS
jgi:hypothetical protein